MDKEQAGQNIGIYFAFPPEYEVKNMQTGQMNGKTLAFDLAKIPAPKEPLDAKLYDAHGDTLRKFRTKKEKEQEIKKSVEVSAIDGFLIGLGAKEMADTPKTTPLEWNSKVVGLIALVFGLFVSIGGMIWYSAGLAAKVDYQQIEINKMSMKLDKIEEYQRQADLRREASRGFEMGVAESSTKGSHEQKEKK